MGKVEGKIKLDLIWRLPFFCIVNSAEKERKMARENK